MPRLISALSVTGNFGADSGSGALMKGSRFAADSMLEGDGFEPSVPRERSLLLPRSELARRNRLAAGTGFGVGAVEGRGGQWFRWSGGGRGGWRGQGG